MIDLDFPPIYNEDCKILILRSFPSAKSREESFYYGHPSNRFWKLMARLLGVDEPRIIEEKTNILLDNGISLYDAVKKAEIEGSMDKDLNIIKVSNLDPIIENSNIEKIFCNGTRSYEIVKKRDTIL